MRRHVWMLLAAGCLAAAAGPGKESQGELERLQGAWQFVSAEREGQKTEDVNKDTLLVTGDTFAVEENGQAVFKGTVKLEPGKSPKAIDWTIGSGDGNERTSLGIYTLDGDKLTFCWAQPGSQRPTGFAPKPGARDLVVILKRKKK